MSNWVYGSQKKGCSSPKCISTVDVTAKGKLLCFFDFWVSRTNEIQLVILFFSVQKRSRLIFFSFLLCSSSKENKKTKTPHLPFSPILSCPLLSLRLPYRHFSPSAPSPPVLTDTCPQYLYCGIGRERKTNVKIRDILVCVTRVIFFSVSYISDAKKNSSLEAGPIRTGKFSRFTFHSGWEGSASTLTRSSLTSRFFLNLDTWPIFLSEKKKEEPGFAPNDLIRRQTLVLFPLYSALKILISFNGACERLLWHSFFSSVSLQRKEHVDSLKKTNKPKCWSRWHGKHQSVMKQPYTAFPSKSHYWHNRRESLSELQRHVIAEFTREP